jgi:acetyl/propionyl-CoA carboxylase alpha subunit
MTQLFDCIVVANRGEIALRIARTCARLGVRSVVTCHALDAESPAAKSADEVLLLEGDDPIAAYLDIEQIIAGARRVGARAIHPGYGFLAENAEFAEAVNAAGLVFVGPSPASIRLMGDKIASREFVREQGFQVSRSATEEEAPASFAARAEAMGFPLLVKASAGGGGKGMHVVRDAVALPDAIERARGEALRYFGDGRLYAERLIEAPRHIEVQILADRHGACLHLLERECSIQRRFQKLIEECPAPSLHADVRTSLHREAVGIARAAGYEGVGTVEFILAPDGTFSFLEMNTRLQVEHPVTEMVTGLDLVEEQLRVAAGAPLRFTQDDVQPTGHAIECRLCAEVPEQDFRPATGRLLLVRQPEGEGIRIDSGVHQGSEVTASFDPMLAKLIAHAPDREGAIARAREALHKTVLLGVSTNTDYLERVLGHPAFAAGELHTGFLDTHADALAADDESIDRAAVAVAALTQRSFQEAALEIPALQAAMGRFRN